MNSMPASSAICASARQSGQLPDQRSGTIVTARPEEQLAPNRPSFSRLALPIAARSRCVISRCISRSLYIQMSTDLTDGLRDFKTWAPGPQHHSFEGDSKPEVMLGKE